MHGTRFDPGDHTASWRAMDRREAARIEAAWEIADQAEVAATHEWAAKADERFRKLKAKALALEAKFAPPEVAT